MITPYTYAIVAGECILGIALSLGSCLAINLIFGYKTRRYALASIFTALSFPVMLLLKYMFTGAFEMNVIAPSAVIGVLIWLIVTDRKLKSLAVTTGAIIFSFSLSAVSIRLVNCFFGSLPITTSPVMYIAAHFMANSVAVGIIVLLCIIGKRKTDEPMSLWNIFLIAALGYIAMSYTLFSEEKQSLTEFVAPVSLIVVAGVIILSVKSSEASHFKQINSIIESYLNAQKKYYETQKRSNNEIRSIKHDMKNHLLCIKQLCANGNYSGLDEYISDISDTLDSVDKSIHTGNEIADVIINEKIRQANELGIDFSYCGEPVNINIKPVDVCTILSNLLDNAIEANSEVGPYNKYVELTFRQTKNFLLITVKNPTVNNIKISDNIIVTTKSDKKIHGFGIDNVRRAVKKYEGELNLSVNKDNQCFTFTTEVMLPKNILL